MDGPDVVGINAGSLGWTLIGLMVLSGLILALATVAQVVAWIGTVLNTAARPDKTWFVVLLVLGLLGLGFVATLIYVIAGTGRGSSGAHPGRLSPGGTGRTAASPTGFEWASGRHRPECGGSIAAGCLSGQRREQGVLITGVDR